MSAKRAALYVRVSRDDRDSDGRNLASQLAMCREYAAERGYRVVAELAEDERGVSGARLDAPQLQRAFDLAESGAFDVLVTREMDRLARDLAKQLIIEKRLEAAGVSIDYVLGDYPDNPEGALMKNVRAVIAEYERLKIVERMTRGIHNYVRAGNTWVAGHHPFGYREAEVDGKKTLVIHEPEARWVRRIFDWYANGDGQDARLGLRAVADKLQAAGVLSPADKSDVWQNKERPRGHWATTTVRTILKNPVYIGRWTFTPTDAEPIVVEVPPVVDRETFEEAQRRLKENLRMARRNVKYNYLLRGRIVCGRCGYRMHGRQYRGKYFYYRCPATYRKDLAVKCDAQTANVEKLDAAVWERIKQTIADPDELRKSYEDLEAEAARSNEPALERVREIDAAIADERRRFERTLDLALDGTHTRTIFEQRQREIERRIAALEEERQRVAADVEEPDAERVETFIQFAAAVRSELAAVQSFERKRWVVEMLEVVVRLDGRHRAHVSACGMALGIVDF